MKRQPTLADKVLAADPRWSTLTPKFSEDCRDKLRAAKKFVLDAQAATYLGEMLLNHPRIVADAQDFAIRPFDLMWIEMPFPPFFQAITGYASDERGDRNVGYLFVGPEVRVASESHGGPLGWNAFFNPVRYTLHQPMSTTQEQRLCEALGCSRVGLDLWFWGESIKSFASIVTTRPRPLQEEAEASISTWDAEGLRALRASHSVDLAPIQPGYKETMAKGIINGSAGDLRNIIALLLFLNRTKDIQYQREVGMGSGLVDRKPRPMMPHTTITLKLDPKPRLMKLAAGEGIRRRLHDVRGHFCHDKTARESGCQHGEERSGDWGEWWQEYDVLRWGCTHCGGKRWWRHEHRRGHPEMGVIKEQTYAVTK